MRIGACNVGQDGMTLVELAIAISIAGIVAMLAVPSLVGMMPRFNLNNDMSTLSSSIAMARASAIAKNQEFRISFSETADSYTLRNETAGLTANTNTLSRNVDMYNIENLGTDDTLSIEPVGTLGLVDGGTRKDFAIGTVGRVYMQTADGSVKRRITIEPMGRIFVERSADGASWTEE